LKIHYNIILSSIPSTLTGVSQYSA
jgi:hypothetical protein